LLLNYHARDKTWQKHGVRRHQVMECAAPRGGTSPDLWEYARNLIDRAVSEGILAGYTRRRSGRMGGEQS